MALVHFEKVNQGSKSDHPGSSFGATGLALREDNGSPLGHLELAPKKLKQAEVLPWCKCKCTFSLHKIGVLTYLRAGLLKCTIVEVLHIVFDAS